MALTSKLAMGLGAAATCPSTEQLQGIYDPSDPCQAVQASSGAYTTISTPQGDYQVLNTGQVLDPSGNLINTAASSTQSNLESGVNYLTSLVSQSSADAIPGISNTVLVLGAGAVLLLMLLSGGRRR